ncbi:FAD linked oxidase-like [Myxococcus hansupus]|uniref:FAD linked oxidase-like n=1 Tax=Pseudomyxococcus hansupus TaxID=1297742 RepID=A0A0H4WTN1_9BACT|nr:FAD linked oxidase-like [Myxococcus hansupus]
MDWAGLGQRLQGAVILSGDERLERAKKQFAAGQPLELPHVLVHCRRTEDVQRTLALLVEHALPFSVRSGGHCFADLSSSAGVVLDLSELNHVECQGEVAVAGPGPTQRWSVAPWRRMGVSSPREGVASSPWGGSGSSVGLVSWDGVMGSPQTRLSGWTSCSRTGASSTRVGMKHRTCTGRCVEREARGSAS